MNHKLNINQIVNEIEKLDYNDEINLLSRIINLLKRKDKFQQVYPITQLKGLGKNIWRKTNISAYIEAER